MKTKRDVKNRKQETEFKLAVHDCRLEYGELIPDDILDEIAFVECLAEDEE
jgi:hypothetical protein